MLIHISVPQQGPVVDVLRTMLQDEGLYSKKALKQVAILATKSPATLDVVLWRTRDPRDSTVQAIATACGYEYKLVKSRTINMEKNSRLPRLGSRSNEEDEGRASEKEAAKASSCEVWFSGRGNVELCSYVHPYGTYRIKKWSRGVRRVFLNEIGTKLYGTEEGVHVGCAAYHRQNGAR
jgi:hypothetical protein